MADFTALKTAIQNAIKQNGNEEITGDILQGILLSIVTTLGDSAINDLITALTTEVNARQQADGTLQQNITNEATTRGNADTALQGLIDGITDNIENGYVYAGIATPSSTPATGKVFYLALTAGTYTNFGSTVVSQGINILKYNGSAWSLDAFIAIEDTPTPNSPKLVKSGGTFESVMANGSAFDISAYFASGGTLATYANLTAALTALDALSADYKRGGMSIKFVQSSDNKYIQFRCKTQSFSVDAKDWYFDGENTLVENPEFIEVKSDEEGKVLEGIKSDGTKYIPTNLNVSGDLFVKGVNINERVAGKIDKVINGVNNEETLSYFRPTENPEWLYLDADLEGKVLSGRKKDGTFVEYCDVKFPNGIPTDIKEYADRKSIKCLFIGNSISQDHVSYVPLLLRNTYPEIDFEICQAYRGNETIKNYADDIIPNNGLIEIFSVAKNTERWTNYNNSVHFDDIFDFAVYDIICFEGYMLPNQGEDTSYFKTFTDLIEERQNSPFKFAYLLHQTYSGDSSVWDSIVYGAQQALITTPVSTLFPCGAVTRFLKTHYGNVFDNAFLTPDYTHANEGLPCLMGAYTIMEMIARYLGLKSKLINNQLRITESIHNIMNVPGTNGTLKIGTEEQYALSQEAATDAVKWCNAFICKTSESLL